MKAPPNKVTLTTLKGGGELVSFTPHQLGERGERLVSLVSPGRKCHDCKDKATHGSRCASCRSQHNARQERFQRRRAVPHMQSTYAPRRCRLCGAEGHDRRLCGRIAEPEDEVWLFV